MTHMRSLTLFALLTFLSFSSVGQELKDIDQVTPFSEGLAAVRLGNQWGFINEKGDLVIDFRDDLVWNKFADSERKDIEGIRYPVFKNGLCMIREMLEEEEIYVYGFIDKTGVFVLEPIYDKAKKFQFGLAPVKIGNKFGYINMKGEVKIKSKFKNAFSFQKEQIGWNK